MRRSAYAIVVVPVLATLMASSPVYSAPVPHLPRTITTVVQATIGDGGPATDAALARPEDLAIAADGDVFVTDIGYHTIRSIDAQTGRIQAVAGNGFSGKPPDLAMSPTDVPLGWPFGLVFDEREDLIFADFTNHQIRFLNRGSTPVTRFGVTIPAGAMAVIAGDGFTDQDGAGRFAGDGGPATDASLNFPRGVALDAGGNLYFGDIDNRRVRRVDAQTGIITTAAGDGSIDLGRAGDGGPAVDASIRFPSSVAFDTHGRLTIAEYSGTIRRVNHAGVIRTIAGTASFDNGFGGDGGPASDAVIGQNPKSLTFDDEGNLFIADAFNDRVRRIDAETRVITTVAGPGGENELNVVGFWTNDVDVPPVDASIASPTGLAFRDGQLLVADELGSLLWTIDPGTDGLVDGDPGERAAPLITGGDFNSPVNLVADEHGLVISPRNRALLYRSDPSGAVTTLAGTGVVPLSIDGPGGDPRDDLGDGGPASDATISPWASLSLGPGNDVYVADWASRRIRVIGAVPDPAGGAPAVGPTSSIDTVVKMPFPSSTIGVVGHDIYFDDFSGHQIWRFDPTTGKRTLFAGSGRAGSSGDGGPATRARLRCVAAMTSDRAARHVFFADVCSGDVRVVDLRTGIIDTVVDLVRDTPFGVAEPVGLGIVGNRFLFVSDEIATSVVRVDLRDPDHRRVRVAGSPYVFTPGYTGDDTPARTAELGYSDGIAIDPSGKLFVTEWSSQRVRRVGVVDILPGVFPNRIDLSANGTIDVAILGTTGVPASSIEPIKIRVAGATPDASGAFFDDVNGDGLDDLVVQVHVQDLQLGPADFEARVVARTYDGHWIRDADWVTPIS